MKALRFDLYSGFSEDKSFTEHDTWVQFKGETYEELADRIYKQILDNAEQLINEDEGEEDDDN